MSYSVRDRIAFIDATRGAGMLFVCLAHFSVGLQYYESGVSARTAGLFQAIGMIASPTFVIVSGLTVGLLFSRAGATAHALRIKLLDRALFMLTLGHLVLVLARGTTWFSSAPGGYRATFITDTIAICLIAGVFLAGRLTPRARAALGVGCYFLGWIIFVRWHPSAPLPRLTEEVLAGRPGHHLDDFPILMWFGVHQLATLAGERLNNRTTADTFANFGRRLLASGTVMLASGLALRFVSRKWVAFGTDAHPFSTWQKFPPGPVYLLFYGGIGVLLVGLLMRFADALWPWLSRGLGVVGRSSFFTYVVQWFVFTTLVPLLHLPVGRLWPVYFTLLLAVTYGLAAMWDRARGNRFLTVGLVYAYDSFEHRKATAN